MVTMLLMTLKETAPVSGGVRPRSRPTDPTDRRNPWLKWDVRHRGPASWPRYLSVHYSFQAGHLKNGNIDTNRCASDILKQAHSSPTNFRVQNMALRMLLKQAHVPGSICSEGRRERQSNLVLFSVGSRLLMWLFPITASQILTVAVVWKLLLRT
jgi:hypothetical protein